MPPKNEQNYNFRIEYRRKDHEYGSTYDAVHRISAPSMIEAISRFSTAMELLSEHIVEIYAVHLIGIAS